MYVREYMTTNVIAVTSDTLIHDAERLMDQHDIRRLPVVDRGKLVGLVTQDRLREVAPSPATSLSVWELNYLLAKMKVRDVMVKDPLTVTPDTSIEAAATLGQQKKIGTLPVVEDGKLVGIITTTDLFKIMTQVLGFGEPHVRLHIFGCARGEPLTHVLDVIKRHGIGFRALFTVTPPGLAREDTIIHLDTIDATRVVEELRVEGCNVEARTF